MATVPRFKSVTGKLGRASRHRFRWFTVAVSMQFGHVMLCG